MSTQELGWTIGNSINEFKDGLTWRVPIWANDAPMGSRSPNTLG